MKKISVIALSDDEKRELRGLLASKGASKDIRLDVENTASTSYVINRAGQGLLSTVRIVHGR